MRCADKKFSEIRGRGIEIALGLFVCWRCEGAGAFACVPPFFSVFPSISFSLGTHAAGRLLRGYLCRCEARCSDGLQVPVQLRLAATGSWPTTDF
nr:MAG TPA: Plasmid SOS inhibition protein (PsiB) [Caudoviricetes sp.]